jgi:hypothetical protein
VDPVKVWLASHLGVYGGIPPDSIESYKFRASPSHEYSEWTSEGFSCEVDVMLTDGDKRTIWMSELETVDFLNNFWEAQIPSGNKD